VKRSLLLLLLLVACSHSPSARLTRLTGVEMTMAFQILIGAPLSSAEQQQVREVVVTTFDEIDQIFNDWNPESEISYLNRLSAHTPVKISPQMAHFLERCGEIVQKTEGRFDPTIRPLQKLWRSRLDKQTLPSNEEINTLLEAVGWDKIHLEGETFSKDHPLTALDLGGIAKGYCVDLLFERIEALGYQDLYVCWGGESRAGGEHPDKRPWQVAIRSPNGGEPLDVLAISGRGVATSGDYFQYWIDEEGKAYTHVCDPTTGWALTIEPGSIASATVLAQTCLEADAIATAIMLGFSAESLAPQIELRLFMRA
jgi:FAD:protein FMN transferase